MSGECDICGEHALECKCPIIRERKWVSKEEAKSLFPEHKENTEIRFYDPLEYISKFYENLLNEIAKDDPNSGNWLA